MIHIPVVVNVILWGHTCLLLINNAMTSVKGWMGRIVPRTPGVIRGQVVMRGRIGALWIKERLVVLPAVPGGAAILCSYAHVILRFFLHGQ